MLIKTVLGIAAIEVGIGKIWVQSDRFVVVCDGILILTKTDIGKAAIDIGSGKIRF